MGTQRVGASHPADSAVGLHRGTTHESGTLQPLDPASEPGLSRRLWRRGGMAAQRQLLQRCGQRPRFAGKRQCPIRPALWPDAGRILFGCLDPGSADGSEFAWANPPAIACRSRPRALAQIGSCRSWPSCCWLGLWAGRLPMHHTCAGCASGLDRIKRSAPAWCDLPGLFRGGSGASLNAGRQPCGCSAKTSGVALDQPVDSSDQRCGAGRCGRSELASPTAMKVILLKVAAWLSDLRVAIVLLLVIAACSGIGTAIPQGEPASFYLERYDTSPWLG